MPVCFARARPVLTLPNETSLELGEGREHLQRELSTRGTKADGFAQAHDWNAERGKLVQKVQQVRISLNVITQFAPS